MCDARTPRLYMQICKHFCKRIEHIEQNVGSLQMLFSMDYWDVSLKNNVKNVQKGITLQNRKVGKLFSLFTKPIDYIFWMCVF